MVTKLSTTQRRALEKLTRRTANGVPFGSSAYSLRESLGTLNSLERLGFAKSRHQPGSLFDPRTGIFFRITQAGLDVIIKEKK